MELTSQVVSLELAKKLKVLGVKQDGYFSWLYADVRSGDVWYVDLTDKEHMIETPDCSAFTVAELGEMLPEWTGKFEEYFLQCYKTICTQNHAGYQIRYVETHYEPKYSENVLHSAMENTEADARAKMLIYLIEYGLLSL